MSGHDAPSAPRWRVGVLGPCVVLAERPADRSGDDPEPVELSAVQRTLLARMAIARPGTVGVDELVDAVWGDAPPATATTSLHNQISRIRRRIGSEAIHTVANRYALTLPTDVEEATGALGSVEALAAAGEHLSAHRRAADGLAVFRGAPLDELIDLEDVQDLRRQLDELHRSLETLRLSTGIDAGLVGWAIPEAERLVASTPHDEHRWALLVRVLDAAGRRGDALGAFDRARRTIASSLGLQPGEELLAAEAAVLRSGKGRPGGHQGELVGRTDLVDAVVKAVLAGRSVLLTGEQGIGRTRLLEAVARDIGRTGAVVGRAQFALHPGSATSTMVDLVDDLGSELDSGLPPVAAVESAVRTAAATRSPLVLCLDDLHRSGPTSLQALLAAATVDRVGVVATALDGADAALDALERFEVIAVPPLDPDGVAELVRSITGTAAPDVTVEWIAAMSGGNPMLVEHLLDDLDATERRGNDSRSDGTGATPDRTGPASPELRELIRHRVAGLGRTTRWTLEIASVLGPRFPADLLDAMAPPDGIVGALADSLLVPVGRTEEPGSGELAFRHGAVREILYDDLATGRRVEIHHAAAEVLAESGAPSASTAVHAIAAAEADPAAAVSGAFAAAGDASALGAHAEAATWYERAVEHAPSTPYGRRRTIEALIGRGNELRLAGSTDQEAALFTATDAAFALGDADLIGDAAFALLQLGATTESGSLHEQAIEVADRALAAISDAEQRALVSGAASLMQSMTGNALRCRELLLDAERLAKQPDTRRQVLPFAFLALGHPSDLPLRRQLTDELLTLGEDANDPVALFEAHQLAFSVALQEADGVRLRGSFRELEQLVVRVGDIGRRWALLYHRAALEHLDGELDAAEATSIAALEAFAPVSPSRAFAVHGGQLLALRIAQGRVHELADVLESLIADQPGVPAWNAACALALVGDDPDRALHHGLAALDGVDDDFTWVAAHLVGGRAVASIGDDDVIAAYVDRLAPWSGLVCWQGTCSYGPVDAVLALLHEAAGRFEDADRHGERALEQARALHAPVFEPELVALRGRLRSRS